MVETREPQLTLREQLALEAILDSMTLAVERRLPRTLKLQELSIVLQVEHVEPTDLAPNADRGEVHH
jgi:hypothetical protein